MAVMSELTTRELEAFLYIPRRYATHGEPTPDQSLSSNQTQDLNKLDCNECPYYTIRCLAGCELIRLIRGASHTHSSKTHPTF